MSLDIGKALRDGVDRTTARNGLALAAVFVVFRLVDAVVTQSLIRVWAEQILNDLAENPPSLEGTEVTAAEFQELITEIRASIAESNQLTYLDSLSLPELLGLAFLLAIVAEAIRIVAVRVFVSSETESIPADLVTRNLLPAVLNGVVGGIVVGLLITAGLVFLIVPGIFIAIAFLFLRQEIAVEDKNFIDAMSGSWGLTSGNRLELFGLVVFLAVLGIAVSFFLAVLGIAVSFVLGLLGGGTVGVVLDTAVSAIVLTYSVAVVSRAYDQLRAGDAGAVDRGVEPDEKSDEFEDIDDELLP
jgi:hypothetical protein